MQTVRGTISRWAACASVALFLIGMLVAKPQGAIADAGGGDTTGNFSNICPDSSCGGAGNTQCNINDNNEGGCKGFCCSKTKVGGAFVCDCVWTGTGGKTGTC